MGTNVGLTFNGSNTENPDSFTAHLAGMSKNQLYDVMSQMKILIEQNSSQAREILVANPALTKALFQSLMKINGLREMKQDKKEHLKHEKAQIMLGMVKPPQTMPNIQQTMSQPPQQSSSQGQQSNTQTVAAPSLRTGQASLSQPPIQHKQPPTMQSVIPSQPTPMPQQIQNPQSIIPGQVSQQAQSNINVSTVSLHPVSQTAVLQSQVPVASNYLQQPLMNPAVAHQPPLPSQPRPATQSFLHQLQPTVPSLQPSVVSSQISSQPTYQTGFNPPSNLPGSLPQAPPLLKHQQIGVHAMGNLGVHGGSSMQVDRVSGIPWTSGPPETSTVNVQLPGPPVMAGQVAPVSRPAQLSPELEKALLQQVMNLTPEQINLLPPEQRQQVLQLQLMLR